MEAELVTIEGLNHFLGDGTLRKQILYDITTAVRGGEIVIVTGPSGSGKTMLLTLIGGLRSVQEGSLRVFGQDMGKARRRGMKDPAHGCFRCSVRPFEHFRHPWHRRRSMPGRCALYQGRIDTSV